jgi:hypothetical protein
MAVSAHGDWLDQFEEGNAAGGHAGEVEAIRRAAVSPSSPRMTARRFPPHWHADPMPGGYVVRDANGEGANRPAPAFFRPSHQWNLDPPPALACDDDQGAARGIREEAVPAVQ